MNQPSKLLTSIIKLMNHLNVTTLFSLFSYHMKILLHTLEI